MTIDAGYQRRLKRWMIVICLSIWAMAALIVLGPEAGRHVMPGSLTSHHAPFEEDCGRCHLDEKGMVKGLDAGFAHSDMALLEGERCQKCHDLGLEAFHSHSMSRVALESITKTKRLSKVNDASGIQNLIADWGLPQSDKGEIACAVCHREHQGRMHTLTSIADSACQSCHVDRDDTFPHRHSEFTSFPFERPTRIQFDHIKHKAEHFPEKGAQYDCSLCHENAGDGQMILKSFEESCTTCHHHDEQILGAGKTEAGVAILRAFGVDLESIEDADLELKDWPADGADYDEPPTALSWALVATVTDYAEFESDRKTLAETDFSDLGDAEESELRAVVRFANAFRTALLTLAEDPAVIHETLKVAGGRKEAVKRMISPAAIQSVTKKWFPKQAKLCEPSAPWGGGGRWYHDDDSLTLFYIPLAHEDLLVRSIHDVATAGRNTQLLAQLKDDARCFKCHTIEGTSKVNWYAKGRDSMRSFNRFDHAPHLLLAGSQGCTMCHEENAASQKNKNDVFFGDFRPILKADCAQCHNAKTEKNGCTDCHNYHVGPFNKKLLLK